MVKLTKKAKKAMQNAQNSAPAVAPPAQVVPKKAKKSKAKASPQLSSTASMYLKCLIDPFNEPACRVPDLYGGQTVAFKLVNEYTISSDGAGYAVFGAGPALSQADSTWTVTAGVTGAVTSTQHSDYTAVNAAYVWTRTVCFGVEVAWVGATSTASGGLTSLNHVYVTDLNSTTLSTVYDDGDFFKATDGCAVVARPIQEPRFESTAGAVTGTPTFPCLNFAAAGLPASLACFRVRVTRHIEGLPQRSSLMRSMAGDSPVDLVALQAASVLGGKASKSANTQPARDSAKKMASAVASTAIEAATPTIVAGAGQMIKWAGESALAWML